MTSFRLELIVDDDLGPALWVRERTDQGTRVPESLVDLRRHAPEDLDAALDPFSILRHRARITARNGTSRRIPVLPLGPDRLLAVIGAVSARITEASADGDLLAVLMPALEESRALPISEGISASPALLTAVVRDLHAQQLVAERRIGIRIVERFAEPRARWHALDERATEMLDALVDARARRALRRHLGQGAGPLPQSSLTDDSLAQDPTGILHSLAHDAPLRADLPARRGIERAIGRYITSGRARVSLQSTENELVVRLFEPADGANWPLQTCLREPDGTVHPVADLRAVGDVTAAGAAEASAEVLRLAPTVRDGRVDETGLDWLLTTEQASAFLAHDTPALEAAGVTVLLPREWTKQRTALRAEAAEAPGEKAGAAVGVGAMASFRWKVAVGDVELTEAEIEEIREAQAELVQLRGRWIRLDSTTLRAAERFLDAFASRSRRGGPPPGPGGPPRSATPRGDGLQHSLGSSAAPGGRSADDMIMDWAGLFSLLVSPDARDVEVEMAELLGIEAEGAEGMDLRTGATGIGRLMAGGPGAVVHPPPTTLRASLRGYQNAGLDWMWALDGMGLGGILADDMGLGKTMQILALLCRERERPELLDDGDPGAAGPDPTDDDLHTELLERAGIDAADRPAPTLLVCPMSVVGAWQREAARFAPHLAVHVHHGGERIRDESFGEGAADMDLVITTYSLLARDLAVLQQVPWDRIVFDEAQHLKNRSTAVSRAARSLAARQRIALTGTPVENRLADLYALMDVVNPGILGGPTSFQEEIASPIETQADPAALSRLRYVTSPFVLRRVKTDRSIISDLPEKIELTRTVNLSPEQAGLYQALVDELMVQIDGAEDAERRSMVVSTLTRLKQVCNHPAHYLGDGSPLLRDGQHRSGKVEFVDDLLENAFAEGEKVLLFTQFTTFGHLLVPHWRERFGMDVPFLHGGVAKKDRDEMVADFQSRPDEPGAMLLSLRAGGTGITLTAANHVVHLDRWWNPAVENQATDRAFRIGQSKNVQVRKLVSAGTVEERIDRVLADKQGLADLTIAPGEGWMADLDDSSLLKLLSLHDENDRATLGKGTNR